MSDSTRINELRKEIEVLCDNCDRLNKEDIGNIILSAMVFGFGEGLKAPSADRPQGEWVVKDGAFYCSCCDNDSAGLSEDDVYVYGIPLPNYCKDCGARMKGADDERR